MEILTAETVPAYLEAHPDLHEIVGSVDSVEMSDQGKINGVFFVRGSSGKLVLKQGLPWVRILPDWPLPADRVAIEAGLLRRWAEIRDKSTPTVHGLDRDRMVLAMEFLESHVLLRELLASNCDFAGVGESLGSTLGNVAVATSPLGMTSEGYRNAVAASQNTALSQLMEDVVFVTPFSDSPSNVDLPVITELRADLIGDRATMEAVAELHWIFATRQEALVHGDLHSGSIMVLGEDVRVIDAEFGRYGPVAWDIGEFWAHVGIATFVHGGQGNRDAAARVAALVPSSWAAFAASVRAAVSDPLRANLLEGWLADVKRVAVRFSGVETLRRVVGVGECEQLLALSGEPKDRVTRQVVEAARCALVDGEPMTDRTTF